jgi:hypothetical protein
MKLGDMTFSESRDAELLIIPEIDKIMSDSETANALDTLLNTRIDKESLGIRGVAAKTFTQHLVHRHYDSTCRIFAALNGTTPEEIGNRKRSEINSQIADMLRDGDLISFFMSPETLARETQSAISQPQVAPSLPKPQSSTSKKRTSAKPN